MSNHLVTNCQQGPEMVNEFYIKVKLSHFDVLCVISSKYVLT